MERKERKRFKVNEDRIYANKFYPYFFTESLRVNVVPISFYTRYQARFTLSKQFGKHWHKYVRIGSGKHILKKGWRLGINSVYKEGKRYQVRKFYIPPEYRYHKNQRRKYIKELRKVLKEGKRSNINRFLKTYYFITI